MVLVEPRLAFITTCMGRLASLRESLPTFVRQPNSHVVVVDYSCPESAGNWVETHCPGCQVVHVPGQRYFHLNRARNAGLRAAPPGIDWLCFVDADVRLSPSFAEHVRPLLSPGRFVVFPMHPRNKGLAGFLLASRADLARCGGFDESYEGYGRQASAMKVVLFGAGLTPVYLGEAIAEHMEHGDDDGPLEADDIRAVAARLLPPWLQPQVVSVTDRFPRLPGGKANRSACAGLLNAAVRAGGPSDAPLEAPGA